MARGKGQFILISGLPPSNGGVGRLMRKLIPIASNDGYLVIVKRNLVSLRSLFKNNAFLELIREFSFRAYDSISFFFRTYFLKNKTILFIHPQTAGVNLLNRLVIRNKVFLYVMDNSFFCIRSYNMHPILGRECIKCLGDPGKSDPQCLPFPIDGNIKKMVGSLRILQKEYKRITFLAQNNNQAKLLRKHFGDESIIRVVGMDTGELSEYSEVNERSAYYDIVYHGSAHLAKGVSWYIEVAECLPHLNFFLPCAKPEIQNLLGRVIKVPNITFTPCSWEDGLREAVTNAKLVCIPSLWSAPIEGALIKSIYWNGEVAVVRSEYGFSQEIPANVVLHLSPDPSIAALEISRHLSSRRKFKDSSHLWLESFRSKNSSSNVFLAVS